MQNQYMTHTNTFLLITHIPNYFVKQGALVLDFVCRIKLEAAFVVTGVKVRAIKYVICRTRQYAD